MSSVPSLLDWNALDASIRLASYGKTKPGRVFMPALNCLQKEKKMVLAGSRRPNKGPWSISHHYQDIDPFGSLIRQREEARNAKPITMTKRKRIKKATQEGPRLAS